MVEELFKELLIEVFGNQEGKRIYVAIENYLNAKDLGIEESKATKKETTQQTEEKYNPMKQMKERNDMIYEYYLSHDISYKELAEMFNITYDHVRMLISRRGGRKKWKYGKY